MKLPKAMPSKAKNYVKELLSYVKPKGLVSAYLFGSSVSKSKGYSKLSDVDVLLIMDDKLSLKELKQLSSEINKIEVKHGYRQHSKGLNARLTNWFNDNLGLFQCHYLWRKSDFL